MQLCHGYQGPNEVARINLYSIQVEITAIRAVFPSDGGGGIELPELIKRLGMHHAGFVCGLVQLRSCVSFHMHLK